ncbi:nuclear transport factor 2 family protein [Virgibacillus senegalensis]|uniref:nuclear transport factor 2 family protein n=1 Tax=Virgibacillus senegalensis TaxID=1499679 RepID=UPI00069FB729|nr:nuclear transport factor 2 family protein [Virgibacillus senegalensis]
MSALIEDFNSFFTKYQEAWNSCNPDEMISLLSKELVVRWARPGNNISDWGYEEDCEGWKKAFDQYREGNPKWMFHDPIVTPVQANEVMAVYWVTFEVHGESNGKINLFVETFRKESDGWKKIRSYSESSIPKETVNATYL